VLLTRSPLGLLPGYPGMDPARLACIRHAASVRPEPGSNSPSESGSPSRSFHPAADHGRESLSRESWTTRRHDEADNLTVQPRSSGFHFTSPTRIDRDAAAAAGRGQSLTFGALSSFQGANDTRDRISECFCFELQVRSCPRERARNSAGVPAASGRSSRALTRE
jgi:hypothetical protein